MRRRHSHEPAAAPAGSSTAAPLTCDVACPYCSNSIPSGDFTPWTGRSELLSAACQCGRIVTVAATAARRMTDL